ncbi:DUF2207 domain-containing protein [Weissella confusa]|uniref:DUF2207 domain-containing protein n=1 Tax=Weissella confusa TaxID=1583 RepID=A0A923SMV8_WEICO|nr:DUF2207 domain-containing protein [Weissella confusa]
MQDGESAFAKRYTDKIDRFEDQVRRAAKPVNLIDHDAVSQLTQWQVWTIVAAVAVVVINGAVWVATLFSATLMDLLAKRVLIVSEEPTKKWRKTNYRIQLDRTTAFNDFEETLLTILFGEQVEIGKSIQTRDKAMQGYVTWLAILPFGLLIRLIVLWRRIRVQNKHIIETPHNYELPSDLPPAVVGWQLRDSGAAVAKFVVDKQAGTLTYEKARVNPDQPVEVHTMFDQAALSTATQRTGNRRAAILDQERAIAERAEKTAK